MNSLFKIAVLAVVLNKVSAASGKAALLVIDVQDCFLPAGSLPVNEGNKIPPVINSIRQQNKFDLTVFSIDWHLRGHVSFASTHQKNVGDIIELQYLQNGTICQGGTITSFRFPASVNCGFRPTRKLQQRLWPDHCIQNVTTGPTSSNLAAALIKRPDDVRVYKGIHKEIDSYSAFWDNGNFFSTDLDSILKTNGITKVFITGFLLDICVFFTSLDAKRLGYETYTIVDASLGSSDLGHVADARRNLTDSGVRLISSSEIPEALSSHSPKMLSSTLVQLLVLTSAVTILLAH